MSKTPRLRNRFLAAAALAMVLVAVPVPAHAASKEIIELQTQVQQLLDMVQRLQSTVDNRFGVIQHLVEQTADNANQMSPHCNRKSMRRTRRITANWTLSPDRCNRSTIPSTN